jgi:hypothetical protein
VTLMAWLPYYAYTTGRGCWFAAIIFAFYSAFASSLS